MSWLRDAGDQLARPFRFVRDLFPFGYSGRQTLIYLLFAGAGPALTLIVIWAMRQSLAAKLWDQFRALSNEVALAHLIVVIGLAMFVSIRAIKIGKDGIEAQGDPIDGGENGDGKSSGA
jgi:hypothetical protein